MDRKIIDALESCRPNHDDLNAHEMDEAARALQSDKKLQAFADAVRSVDEKITEEIHQVPVPEGLQQRLIAKLNSSVSDPTSSEVLSADLSTDGLEQPGEASAAPESDKVSVATRPAKLDRRSLIVAGIGFAGVAASLMIAFMAISNVFQKQTPEQLAAWANDLSLEALKHESESWDSPPSKKLSVLDDRDFKVLPDGYKRLSKSDVLRFPGKRRFLFVKRVHASSRISTFPSKPVPLSNGWRYGTWRSKDHVFVVMVQGSDQDYFDLVNATSRPMA